MKSARICIVLALLAAAGCASVPPERAGAARMDYGQVIADSWKRQTLLNVVRMRYADTPVFLDIASVINSYSVGGKGSLASLNQTAPGIDSLSIGMEGTWSNTPTVTYQPVIGDRFTRSMLQPVPPVAVLQLMQGGWPVERVMRIAVRSINGLRNDSFGAAASEAFHELVGAMARIQANGGLGIRVEPRKDGSAVVVVMRSGDAGTQLLEDRRRVQQLLGLADDALEFSVDYGLLPRSRGEVAMLTRSMLELILELGFGIELPASHVTDGRALPGQLRPGDREVMPLARIHSGAQAPADAYAAVPYRGIWYWIDDGDIRSKGTFTFLMILFSLAETGQTSPAPVVTVPSR